MSTSNHIDIYGIGIQIRTLVTTWQNYSRRTGRTAQLVDAARDGDRVICHKPSEAVELERRFRLAGKTVQVCLCDTAENPLAKFGTARGRTWFDHGWIETFYGNRLTEAARDIAYLEEAMSKRHPAIEARMGRKGSTL
ncbi:hypothetical protein [Parvibaculum sp.]|uniref:hypothetical protein n=1 Tax=Parvibaculum sp. TaxID=2024848 RepID=UPI0027303950|nr:hypothetical protein [Parvibaculum sp.]MDP1628819.1 hypothetical protein [Parvibaculum sp.]MDP2148214.1 hypothetical protein [Parvibaculum sp.]MDP3327724.1 hypothetical protein [Parvibaculum sp.]